MDVKHGLTPFQVTALHTDFVSEAADNRKQAAQAADEGLTSIALQDAAAADAWEEAARMLYRAADAAAEE